jgi:hypothetical protein
VPVPSAFLELPVPADWVQLPERGDTGVEAAFISVADMAELDVFSVPFQSSFDGAVLDERAAEIGSFVSADLEGVETRPVTIDSVDGMVLTATWNRMDQPADVLAIALPTRGRTTLVLLIMGSREASRFATVSRLLEARTHVASKPAPVPSHEAVYEDPQGFSLALPAGWRRVTAGELEVISAAARTEGRDATSFVHAGIHRQSPNLVVDMPPSPLLVSEEMLSEFELRYRDLIAARESGFTLDRSTLETVAGRESFHMIGRIETPFATILQHQYFIPSGDRSLILTFSAPETAGAGPLEDMESIVSSLTFLDDVPAPRPVAEPPRDRSMIVLALVLASGLGLVVLAWRLTRRYRAGR